MRTKKNLTRLLPKQISAHNDNEMSFILSALSYHLDNNLKPGLETDQHTTGSRIISTACREGVQGILYHRLKSKGSRHAVMPELEKQYYLIASHNNININALENIENALKAGRVEAVTLKGASLLESIYPGVGMRSMGDIDIMVRPEDLKQFEQILVALGYSRDLSVPHIFRKGTVVLDIHIHALNTDRIKSRAYLFPSGMKPVWENSVPWKTGYRWLRKPDDIDNLILLSQHAMKHSFSTLVWIYDMYELLQNRGAAFWAALAQRVDRLGQRRAVTYSLAVVSRTFSFEPPEGSGFEKPFRSISGIERRILEAGLDGRSGDTGPILALFCMDGVRNRIRFGLETAFPGSETAGPGLTCPQTRFCSARILSSIGMIFRRLIRILNIFTGK